MLARMCSNTSQATSWDREGRCFFSGRSRSGSRAMARLKVRCLYRYFLDREGSIFKYVLAYLRGNPLPLPSDGITREQLAQEANYFQVGLLTTLQA